MRLTVLALAMSSDSVSIHAPARGASCIGRIAGGIPDDPQRQWRGTRGFYPRSRAGATRIVA